MILYHPIEGEIYNKKIIFRPRTCFLMTKLGCDIPVEIKNIRSTIIKYLKEEDINVIDANTIITGRDFLLKIWEIIISVPLGIAIITDSLTSSTMANIFYEIGILQSIGKETLVVKSKECTIPSDFVRTEYIEYGRGFKRDLKKYIDTIFKQADHYIKLSDELEKNPLAAIDYLRRAYLINGDVTIQKTINEKIKRLFDPKFFDTLSQDIIKNSLKI